MQLFCNQSIGGSNPLTSSRMPLKTTRSSESDQSTDSFLTKGNLYMKLRNLIIPTVLIPMFVACGTVGENVDTLQQPLTEISQMVSVSSSAMANVQANQCENSPGPYITLNGKLSLGSFGMQLVFRNNMKGTHEHTEGVMSDVVIISTGESITIPKQPVLGGVGGNPHILVQLVDSDGNALSDEMYLGRCVQGLSDLDSLLGVPGLADAFVGSLDCSNSPGPFISVDGDLTLKGVSARIIFRNNMKGTHETDVVKELELMADGLSFTFPKQPVLGGVGGNPHIWLRYVDGEGNVLGEEAYLGRCKQLEKTLK